MDLQKKMFGGMMRLLPRQGDAFHQFNPSLYALSLLQNAADTKFACLYGGLLIKCRRFSRVLRGIELMEGWLWQAWE